MILTDEQVVRIEYSINQRGVVMQDLLESIVDHVCCQIENSSHFDFEEALNEAMAEFDAEEMTDVQEDIKIQIQFKRFVKSKKWQFSLGFLASFLITTGILFKQMHWPSAGICLVLGVFILNFGFLPLYFIDRYKSSLIASN